MANPPSRLVLKNLCLSNKPDFLFIAEPWISVNHLSQQFWHSIKMRVFVVNSRENNLPNLWCACKESLDPSVIESSDQHVAFSFMHNNQLVCVSAIYASTSYLNRRKLWQDLNRLQQLYQNPWCFIGDYNMVLGSHEYRGSGRLLQIASDDFRVCSDQNHLTHLVIRGAFYTWSNSRRGRSFTEKRLDRVICNDSWLNYWSSVSCCSLTRSRSDHFPILLDFQSATRTFSSSFKFMSVWTSHPGYADIVSEVWKGDFAGCPMLLLSQKLIELKKRLKVWNKSVFGDVNVNMQIAMDNLNHVQD